MNIKDTLKLALADRSYLAVVIALSVAVIAIVVLGIAQIRPSELQIPVRYSSFGITNFYRDRWYYLIGLVLFAVVMAVMHVLISLKLYELKGRQLAIAFLWLSVMILTIALVFIYAVLRVATL